MKKTLALLLAAALLLAFLPVLGVSAEGSVGLVYESNGDGTCTLTGIGTCEDTDVVIPSKSPAGDTVTEIGEEAFYGNTTIESVTIPASVTFLYGGAFFKCAKLASVTVPGGALVSPGTFGACPALTGFTVSGETTECCAVDGVLFSADKEHLICFPAGKKTTDYTVPDTVFHLYPGAFCGNVNLKTVTLPESVTAIGEDAFYCCTALEKVTITSTEAEISYYAFAKCPKLATVLLPESMWSIREGAFSDCTALASITVPDGIGAVEYNTFKDCTALKSVTLTKNLRAVNGGAFSGCTALCDVYYAGTKDEWDAVYIDDDDNEPFLRAKLHLGAGSSEAGDVDGNGEVTADDLTALARHVGKIETLTDARALAAADYNGDSDVTSDDLTALARKIAKID